MKYTTLDTSTNAAVALSGGDEESARILESIARRKQSISIEMKRFQGMCDRYDNLYYPNTFTRGGADHWPDDPNLKVRGKSHVSVNAYPTYVDVPAALQSPTPIENIVAPADQPELRPIATQVERMYFAWKEAIDYETTFHKAAVSKGLYGKTAAKVYWDEEMGMPTVSLVEQPRNLWLGWASNDYRRLEWADYVYLISYDEAIEQYGLDLRVQESVDDTGEEVQYLYVMPEPRAAANMDASVLSLRDWLVPNEGMMLEVNDYWCKKPMQEPVFGQPTPMVVRNIITVGNKVVLDEAYEEYDGKLPFIPVFNTFIPGVPEGKPDIFDVEQLLREKDERISSASTMVGKAVGRQFWQLTGPDAPDRIPVGLRPKPDEVIAPGAGNRIEPIQPWMPEFQVESYLSRLDRELQDVSGLNDLLRGLAPSQVLSSSKAIVTLISNYEARITLRRRLFYRWRQDIWEMVKGLWSYHNEALAGALSMAARLNITPPSLTPRDDAETMMQAMNLMNAKIWTQERAMDATGVEDPQSEQEIMRAERQDPAMFPADVQAQAALAAMLQQLQMNAQQMQPQQQGPSQEEADADAMAAESGQSQREGVDERTPQGSVGAQGPEEQPFAPEGGSAFRGEGDYNAVSQGMLHGGQFDNRVLVQQPLTDEEG